MRYVIKEKVFTLGGDFKIYNEQKEPVFLVRGKALSLSDKMSFQSPDGEELVFMKKKMVSWKPTYLLIKDGVEFGKVVQEVSFFKKKFTLHLEGREPFVIRGKFWWHDYKFERGGKIIASVEKAVWAWRDTYGIEIADGESDVLILAAVVAIDRVMHDQKR